MELPRQLDVKHYMVGHSQSSLLQNYGALHSSAARLKQLIDSPVSAHYKMGDTLDYEYPLL